MKISTSPLGVKGSGLHHTLDGQIGQATASMYSLTSQPGVVQNISHDFGVKWRTVRLYYPANRSPIT